MITLSPFIVYPSYDGTKPDIENSIRVFTKAEDSNHAIAQALLENPSLNEYQGKLVAVRTDVCKKKFTRFVVYPSKGLGRIADPSVKERIEIVAENQDQAINSARLLSPVFQAYEGKLFAMELSEHPINKSAFRQFTVGQFIRRERKTNRIQLKWAIFDESYTIVECYGDHAAMRRRYQLLNRNVWLINRDLFCPPKRYSPVVDPQTNFYNILDNFTSKIVMQTEVGPDTQYRRLPDTISMLLKTFEEAQVA